MLAIHNSTVGFHPRWIEYCTDIGIPFKLVDCYSTNIISELKDCEVLLWHFSQGIYKDMLFAKQLLFSLQHAGIKVFPDFNTVWHFDDKLGQKYLLEALNIPLVPTYVFLNKQEALNWINTTNFPKVWKLRGGAGSANVKLIQSKAIARKYVKTAFGKGFSQYDKVANLKERWRSYRLGKTNFKNVLRGILRFFNPPEYSKVKGRERGYIYFQDFIPNNNFDIRVIVIGERAFAIKRMVRNNDFRASGSGSILSSKSEIDERCVTLALEINAKLNAQCLAYDFVFDSVNNPILIEISYGFSSTAYDECPGYWDKDLNWKEGKFNPFGWIVDLLINR